ncbi:hypothetical protein [Endothiovibrio diazotrophicus]
MKIIELLQSLADKQVRYVLVGGLAVQLLTMKRATRRAKDRMDIEALEKIQRGEDPNE